jgi:hypothetical protein
VQRIAFWLAPAVMVGVAIFIVVFLFDINEAENIEVESIKTQSLKPKKTDVEDSPVWMKTFSNSEQLGFSYPVNEIFIEVDLDKEIIKKTIYRLSAQLKDPYQLFCLRQELKRHNFLYYLNNSKPNAEILIFSKDKRRLESLVTSLESYQIYASLNPYKEEQKWKNIE